MTTISIADCLTDNGYLSEFANVDFHPLPHAKLQETEQTEETKDNPEDDPEDLKTQISHLTRELTDMKAFMAEKLKQQVI